MPVLRIGISACLLGAPVRHDATDKAAAFRRSDLEAALPGLSWVPVCPEVESGMPVPREPVRLEGPGPAPRMVGLFGRADHTERMVGWAAARLRRLAPLGLAGFVLKARSPSCGPRAVPLWDASGAPAGETEGLFAAALAAALPGLPVEDEVRLADPAVRAAFVAAVRQRRSKGS